MRLESRKFMFKFEFIFKLKSICQIQMYVEILELRVVHCLTLSFWFANLQFMLLRNHKNLTEFRTMTNCIRAMKNSMCNCTKSVFALREEKQFDEQNYVRCVGMEMTNLTSKFTNRYSILLNLANAINCNSQWPIVTFPFMY